MKLSLLVTVLLLVACSEGRGSSAAGGGELLNVSEKGHDVISKFSAEGLTVELEQPDGEKLEAFWQSLDQAKGEIFKLKPHILRIIISNISSFDHKETLSLDVALNAAELALYSLLSERRIVLERKLQMRFELAPETERNSNPLGFFRQAVIDLGALEGDLARFTGILDEIKWSTSGFENYDFEHFTLNLRRESGATTLIPWIVRVQYGLPVLAHFRNIGLKLSLSSSIQNNTGLFRQTIDAITKHMSRVQNLRTGGDLTHLTAVRQGIDNFYRDFDPQTRAIIFDIGAASGAGFDGFMEAIEQAFSLTKLLGKGRPAIAPDFPGRDLVNSVARMTRFQNLLFQKSSRFSSVRLSEITKLENGELTIGYEGSDQLFEEFLRSL